MSSKSRTRRISAAKTKRATTMRSQSAKKTGTGKRALWIGGLALGAAAAVGAMLYFSKNASAATITQLPPGPSPTPGPSPSGGGTPSGGEPNIGGGGEPAKGGGGGDPAAGGGSGDPGAAGG